MPKQSETEKYTLIMEAAALLFSKQGYKKTTVDEIVAKAGISKGLFYHYFPNKQALYLQLYHTYADLLSKCIRERVDTSETDFFARLSQITRIRIDFVRTYPNLWHFLYSAYTEEHPDVAPLIRDKNQSLLQQSYSGSAANIDWSALKSGLTPEAAIELVTWVAEGFVRKVTADGLEVSDMVYNQFDDYITYLKTGMCRERGESHAIH